MKPKITLFATAIRPECWMDFYGSIGTNDTPFEVIFVGPNEPHFKLPFNFKYIKSNVKPAQCAEIACRHAIGDLVMNVSDDCEFRTEHPLDNLYETYIGYNNEKLILSCRYMQNGIDRSETDHFLFCIDTASPVMPMHSLMSRKLYQEIGGIDRDFIAVFWDLDIAMRVYVFGGTVILSDVYSDEIKGKKADSDLCVEYGGIDRWFLEYLWTYNGKVHFNRSKIVEPFSDYRIIEETQGPRGRW